MIDVAKEVVSIEIEGLQHLLSNIDQKFNNAVEAILKSEGRVIICGMGKSGIIGKKIAASLASTGTPSFYMHPGEAFHGDLGMVKKEDVFIAISNSGETDEVLKLLPFLRDNQNTLIGMTGNSNSTLALNAHIHLNISVPQEACTLKLAPTASTTATLAMGDALTIALMNCRDFKPENFARFHPGGSLGRKLLSKVGDEMEKGKVPTIDYGAKFSEIVDVITSNGLGVAVVTKQDGSLGIITDGDLRRAVNNFQKGVFEITAIEFCSPEPMTISIEESYENAIEKMEEFNVTSLLVFEGDEIVGLIQK